MVTLYFKQRLVKPEVLCCSKEIIIVRVLLDSAPPTLTQRFQGRVAYVGVARVHREVGRPVPLGQVPAEDGVRPLEVDALEVVAGLQAEVLEVRGPDGQDFQGL